jgi:hypothetical protein
VGTARSGAVEGGRLGALCTLQRGRRVCGEAWAASQVALSLGLQQRAGARMWTGVPPMRADRHVSDRFSFCLEPLLSVGGQGHLSNRALAPGALFIPACPAAVTHTARALARPVREAPQSLLKPFSKGQLSTKRSQAASPCAAPASPLGMRLAVLRARCCFSRGP